MFGQMFPWSLVEYSTFHHFIVGGLKKLDFIFEGRVDINIACDSREEAVKFEYKKQCYNKIQA